MRCPLEGGRVNPGVVRVGETAGMLPTTRQVDVEHRSLLAEALGSDPDDLFEGAIELAACALEQLDPRRVAAGPPATARARRMLADGARETLAADPLVPSLTWRARSASPPTSAAFSIRSRTHLPPSHPVTHASSPRPPRRWRARHRTPRR
jgi:hypothetical protein